VTILRSVVGKLWLTIMGLVAIVLMIVGLLLYRYIDSSFPKFDEQRTELENLALQITTHAAGQEGNYIRAWNDMLEVYRISAIRVEQGAETYAGASGGLALSQIWTAEEMAQLEAGASLSKQVDVADGPDVMAVGMSVTSSDGRHGGYITLYQPIETVEQLQFYVKVLFALAGMIGFTLTTFFAFFLITRLTRPLQQLKQAAGLITKGNYNIRVSVQSNDELGDLAKTFNIMAERLAENITALQYEKENLSSVLSSMSDAVLSFDVNGTLVFMNPHGERLLKEWNGLEWGADDSERQEEPQETKSQTGDLPEPLRVLFDEVIRDTNVRMSTIHVKTGVWSVVMAPLYSQQQVRGVVVVLRDVTEEYRLDKMRKDFVANVSHELRTPLSMLQGYSEALLDDIVATPEERQELVQIIHDESVRMSRLVQDLLDLARMEAGHLEMNMARLALQPLMMRVHRKFSNLCREKGIVFEYEGPEEEIVLPQADEDRLEQVLTNLLSNALRHTPEGKRIVLRLARHDAKTVLIEVADEGEGIPAEDLPYVFERFYKADKSRKRGSSGGTGLGLAIVKNLVEAHKGTVSVTSALGQGTTFSILLPAE